MMMRMKCQCAERREAYGRMNAAKARGDAQAVQIEQDFIRRTLLEDATSLVTWTGQKLDTFTPQILKRGRDIIK